MGFFSEVVDSITHPVETLGDTFQHPLDPIGVFRSDGGGGGEKPVKAGNLTVPVGNPNAQVLAAQRHPGVGGGVSRNISTPGNKKFNKNLRGG